jgi:hypothetical protein
LENEIDFKELVTVPYEGYEISYQDWKTTELCIVHSPGKDDYYFDGTALECFRWIDHRIESVLDSARREYLKKTGKIK